MSLSCRNTRVRKFIYKHTQISAFGRSEFGVCVINLLALSVEVPPSVVHLRFRIRRVEVVNPRYASLKTENMQLVC
jgi:hypothetical protein